MFTPLRIYPKGAHGNVAIPPINRPILGDLNVQWCKMNIIYTDGPVRKPANNISLKKKEINSTPPLMNVPIITTRNMGMMNRVAPPPPGTSCGCGGGH